MIEGSLLILRYPKSAYLNQIGIDVVSLASLQHDPGVVVGRHVPVPIQSPVIQLFRLIGGKILRPCFLFALLPDFLKIRNEKKCSDKLLAKVRKQTKRAGKSCGTEHRQPVNPKRSKLNRTGREFDLA